MKKRMQAVVAPPNSNGLPRRGDTWGQVKLSRNQQVKQEAEMEPACAWFSKVARKKSHHIQKLPPVHISRNLPLGRAGKSSL